MFWSKGVILAGRPKLRATALRTGTVTEEGIAPMGEMMISRPKVGVAF